MELNWLILVGFGLVSIICGIVGSSATAYMLYRWDMKRIDDRIESLNSTIKGNVSGVVRNERKERQSEALAKVMVLIKTGKQPMDALKEVAMEYPDVAMELAKKAGIGL